MNRTALKTLSAIAAALATIALAGCGAPQSEPAGSPTPTVSETPASSALTIEDLLELESGTILDTDQTAVAIQAAGAHGIRPYEIPDGLFMLIKAEEPFPTGGSDDERMATSLAMTGLAAHISGLTGKQICAVVEAEAFIAAQPNPQLWALIVEP